MMTSPPRLRRVLPLAAILVIASSAGPAAAQEAEQQPQGQQQTQPRQEQRSPEDLAAEIDRYRQNIVRMHEQLRDMHAEQAAVQQRAEELRKRIEAARDQGADPERIEAMEQESRFISVNQLRGRIQQLRDRIASEEILLASRQRELAARQAEQQAIKERRQRQAELQSVEHSRAVAARYAREVAEEVDSIASQPDAAEALRRSVTEAEIEQLRARYIGLQHQAHYMRSAIESGHASPAELIRYQAEAQAALAELRRATLQNALEQVERERGEFSRRNQQPAEVSGQVLQTEFFRGYLDTVQQYAQLSRDSDSAAVAAVLTAADLLRDQEPQATIDYFEPMLARLREGRRRTAQGPGGGLQPPRAVETAISLHLAEAYQAAGRREEALGVLRDIVLGHTQAPPPEPVEE